MGKRRTDGKTSLQVRGPTSHFKNGLGWLGSLHRFVDWTQGCVAVTNDEIEEIWDMVPDGIRVEIVP
jgi:hypothetical protein